MTRIRYRHKMRGYKYWYYTEHYECVLCGMSYQYKFRIYSKKPGLNKRNKFVQYACDTHFL